MSTRLGITHLGESVPPCDDHCDIPVEIENVEKIVRAVKTPYYFHRTRKNELIAKALFPPPEASEVSVVRHIMGDDYCAERSRETGSAGEYAGMLVLVTGDVRQVGSDVYDYRADYCGHAHINHGIKMPAPGETMSPQDRDALNERCKAILKLGAFHTDPAATGQGWQGSPL
ncbi:MAG: hypothetical protein EON54_28085 [Alcaligenaceae bacterium]|nr:MAG: hypothetical protein EON54_28085 [Alcaligenaceae bacterium]